MSRGFAGRHSILASGVLICTLSLALFCVSYSSCADDEGTTTAEPRSRFDMGWNVDEAPGGNWLPDVVANRTGTFFRKDNHLILLEGINSDQWSSLRTTLKYGGIFPAGTMAITYTWLYAARMVSSLSSLRHLGYSISRAVIIYTWFWQARNLYNNVWSSGYWYLGTKMLAGMESRQNGRGRNINPGVFSMPFAMLLARSADGLGQMINGGLASSVDIELPPSLADRMFLTLSMQDSEPGAVRIHRVPRVLREVVNDKRNHQHSTEWNNLLNTLERSRIDRLTLFHRDDILQGRFLDYRSQTPGVMRIEPEPKDKEELPVWLESFMTAGGDRRGVESFRSVLHPKGLLQFHKAFECQRTMPEGLRVFSCSGGILHQVSDDAQVYSWVPDPADEPQDPAMHRSWVQEENDQSHFYFRLPHRAGPYLSWSNGVIGDSLKLVTENAASELDTGVTQTRISERAGFALMSELDYLVRWVSHALVGEGMIPLMQGALGDRSSREDPLNDGLNHIDEVLSNYAPGWLNTIDTLSELGGRQ